MQPKYYSQLTPAERRQVRLQYIEEQEHECWHCHSNIHEEPPKAILEKRINWSEFPKGFLNNPIHLHHNHNTDFTIGAVHAYCNAVLWDYFGQ